MKTMNRDYETNIAVTYGYETDGQRPVLTYSKSLANAMCEKAHTHPRAQILSCDRGTMEVVTQDNVWIVNSTQSIWLASYDKHQVYFPNHVNVTSAFIDQSRIGSLPQRSFAFSSSDFLNSLLEKVTSFSNLEKFTDQQLRVVEVLLDELSGLTPTSAFLPMSKDPRVRKVTSVLMNQLGSKQSIKHYAELACVSPRTLSRLFRSELGMSFTKWRIRMKLTEAVRLLNDGKNVTEVSFALGYEEVSSFIDTFKKHFQTTPSNYLKRS